MTLLVLGLANRAAADTAHLASGEIVTGIVRSVKDGTVTIDTARAAAGPLVQQKAPVAIRKDPAKKSEGAAPSAGSLRTIPLADVVELKFEPIFDRSRGARPLVDNDPARNGRSASGTIKLRRGYHRFALAYWHRDGEPLLHLAYCRVEKPGEERQRFVPRDMLAHLETGASEIASPGVDTEGYRLPEKLSGEVAPNVPYTLRRRPDGRPFERMGDVLKATSTVDHGMLDRISPHPLPTENHDLALVAMGYLHIEQDGLYKFLLSSDGGSQLYVGQTPSGLRSIDSTPPVAPWTVALADGGSLNGKIERWTDSKVGLSVAAGRSRVSLAIPSSRIVAIWSNKSETKSNKESKQADTIDRGSPPVDQDVVFAHSATGPVQRVPCSVEGIQGESLVLRFNGANRKIALSRVVGMLLASGHRAAADDRAFHEIVEIDGGIKFPGKILAIDATMTKVRTSWGDVLTLQTEDLVDVSVKNGKAIWLTERTPSDVTQVPFFRRVIGYRVNESLSGGPILLRDGIHSRGISVHARTVLRYVIGGHFQRFRAKLGFQLPEGEEGDASIEVRGDEKVLFARASLRGDGPIEPVDLDVTGVGLLTLAVDFGRGENVGDRVVWADPVLIRAEIGPLPAAPQPHPAK